MKLTSTFLFSFLFFLNLSLTAQIEINWLEVSEEPGPNGSTYLYAINKGYCPLTIILDFDKNGGDING